MYNFFYSSSDDFDSDREEEHDSDEEEQHIYHHQNRKIESSWHEIWGSYRTHHTVSSVYEEHTHVFPRAMYSKTSEDDVKLGNVKTELNQIFSDTPKHSFMYQLFALNDSIYLKNFNDSMPGIKLKSFGILPLPLTDYVMSELTKIYPPKSENYWEISDENITILNGRWRNAIQDHIAFSLSKMYCSTRIHEIQVSQSEDFVLKIYGKGWTDPNKNKMLLEVNQEKKDLEEKNDSNEMNIETNNEDDVKGVVFTMEEKEEICNLV
jgi:hypothetical protein